MTDDDLTRSPLWDALRAPGTAEELAGEHAALSAFRGAAALDLRRRRAHRLAVGGAGLALFAATSGGVAAAYSGSLPSPVQHAVHAALAPLGVPAAPPAPPVRRHSAPVAPPASSSVGQQHRTAPRPGAPVLPPSPSQRGSTPRPAAPAAPSPAPPPPRRPSPTPTAVPAPRLTAATSSSSVAWRGDVRVTGRLTQGGEPVAGATVFLARRFPGQDAWTRIGQATTGDDGRVAVVAKDLGRNVVLRLASRGAVSGGHAVTVRPAVAVSVSRPGPQRRVLRVTTQGAQQGDVVQLLRLDGSTWKVVTKAKLDGDAAAAFTVATPKRGQTVRYRVKVLQTRRHGTGLRGVALSGPGASS